MYLMEIVDTLKKIIPPTRIDFMSASSFWYFTKVKGIFSNYTIDIENPLPNAKSRGVYKVVFINKKLIKDKNMQWLQI